MPMRTITIILLIFLTSFSQAQESYLYKRTNIKLGHSTKPDYLNSLKRLTLGNFRLEANQGVSRFVELGAYVGYSRFGNVQYQEGFDPADNTTWDADYIYSDAYSYGITANLHLFPFIAKNEEPRFDLYLTAKFGGLSLVAPEGSVFRGHGIDYGLYGCASFILPDTGAYLQSLGLIIGLEAVS